MSILWVDDEIEQIKKSKLLPTEIYTSEKDFTKAQKLIKSLSIIKYDAIILDINLEKSETTPEIIALSESFDLDSEAFKKEAGFHLFIDLIESGYPKEKIVCFTGNATQEDPIEFDFIKLKIAPDGEKWLEILEVIDKQMKSKISKIGDKKMEQEGKMLSKEEIHFIIQSHINQLYLGNDTTQTNTCGEFYRKFFAARITPPDIISKNDSECLLPSWIDNLTSDDYVQLRRLLINYSLFLIDELNNNLEIHHRLKDNEKFCFKNNEAISLLENVIHLLPIQKPESKSELSHTFKQLVFIMSHHWDTLEWPNKFNFYIDFKNEETAKKEKEIVLKCFFIIMKTVRNWSHHGDIFEKIDERTLAYLFLINARALFDLGDKCSSHETKLLKFISHPKGPMKLEDFEEKCKRRLSHHVQYARIINKFGHRRDLGINQILNESVKNLNNDRFKFTSQDLIHGLFDCFWFLTSPPRFNKDGAEHTKPHGVQLSIHFPTFNYNAYPFLTDLSRHLFYKTFN